MKKPGALCTGLFGAQSLHAGDILCVMKCAEDLTRTRPYADGIYECHGHLMMDGADFASARNRHKNGVDETALRKALEDLRSAGVRYFRDGGDAYGVSALGRDIAPEYGIEVITPVFAIHKKGYYGSIVGRSYDGTASFHRRIDELREAKGNFVKLMLSGIITFRTWGDLSCEGLDPDEIKELVNIAHSEGYRVMAHVNGAKTIRAALLAGADSIEHGYFAGREDLELMAEKNVIWVPTLTAVEAFVERGGFDRSVAEKTVEEQEKNIRQAHGLGVLIAAGSDSGAVGVLHGKGILREHELLARCGLTAEEAETADKELWNRFSGRVNYP